LWPTEATGWLLLAGAATLLLVLWRSLRRGWAGLLSLRLLGVVFFWVGYHLSPLMSYFGGTLWDHYLLVPGWIDEGLLFSLLCMWGYLAGYWLNARSYKGHVGLKLGKFELPAVRPLLLVGLIALSVACFLVTIGGAGEAWRGSMTRGEGQFEARDWAGKLKQMVSVVGTPVSIFAAVAGAAAVLRRQSSLGARLAGFAALAAASLTLMQGFSRAAGYPLLILGGLAVMSRGRRGLWIAAVCVPVAAYTGFVGYHARGLSNPGVGNYLQAAGTPNEWIGVAQRSDRSVSRNSLDAMAAWTRKVWTRGDEEAGPLELALTWTLDLNPLPSEVVRVRPVGKDLSVVMGTFGNVGLTTPAFAELYYAFYRWGAILMIPLGALLSFFDRLPQRLAGAPGVACWALAALCFPLGLHSGDRTMTRPLLYGVVLYGLSVRGGKRRGRRAMAGRAKASWAAPMREGGARGPVCAKI